MPTDEENDLDDYDGGKYNLTTIAVNFIVSLCFYLTLPFNVINRMLKLDTCLYLLYNFHVLPSIEQLFLLKFSSSQDTFICCSVL